MVKERLRELLKLLGLKQYQFAKAIGVSGATISDWLNTPNVNPSIDSLIRISELYNVNLNWLITGKGYTFNLVKKQQTKEDQPDTKIDDAELQSILGVNKQSRIKQGDYNNVRAREVVNLSNNIITLPVVADIAAGTGIEAYDVEPAEYINVDRSLISLPGPYLCFKVSGVSMSPYILDSDYAIVTQDWADLDFNQHVCAFRTLEGLVLKRFYMRKNRKSALLIPLNPTSPIVEYTQDSPEYTLLGLLVTIIRKFI